MKWFGESWGAPVCEPGEHVDTPTGKQCDHCWYVIKPGDRGFHMPVVGSDIWVTYHRDCMWAVLGIADRIWGDKP